MFNQIRMLMNSGGVVGNFLQVVPITCVVGVTYAVLRFVYLKRKGLPIAWPSEIMKALFVCYLTGLFNLLLMPANFWLSFFDGIAFGWWDEMGSFFSFGGFNLVPTLVSRYLHEPDAVFSIGSWILTMLIGNVAMFVPLGFFVPFVSERISVKKILGIAVFVPLTVELLQMFLGRSFDIDDWICNFLGVLIGFFVAAGVKAAGKRLWRRNRK